MNSTAGNDIRYSIVIPIYNEEAVLPMLLRRLDILIADQLDETAEVIFVDDGSRDCSSIVLEAKAKSDPRYQYLGLSRNFGHQIAISAGMDAASGDAVIVMDADLQDPPEVIFEMIARWKDGYDIVNARRLSRAGENAFKRWTAHAFYRLLGRLASVEIPSEVGDFRLIDRRVLEAFRQMPEQDRFVRGMFAWLGFRQTEVTFHREARAAGETKYPLWKMLKLALNGILGFSDAPLRLSIWRGFCVSGCAVLYGFYAIAKKLLTNDTVTGWSSTVVVISFLCGVNMLMTGIVGLYIGRIHAEVKQRPLYVVGRRVGFQRQQASSAVPKPLRDARGSEQVFMSQVFTSDSFAPARTATDWPAGLHLAAFALVVAQAVFLATAFATGVWLIDGAGRPIADDFVGVWPAGRMVLDGQGASVWDAVAHRAAGVAALGHDFDGSYPLY